jgi:Holliday junction resolvase RusA-like endonuclease
MPRPQGSIRAFQGKHGGIVTAYPDAVWVWRRLVQAAGAAARDEHPGFTGAVELRMGFDLPRPLAHFLPVNGRRSEPVLRDGAPRWPIGTPDLDKLARCVADALTDATVWKDDAQVVSLTTAKRYAAEPGVLITIKEL